MIHHVVVLLTVLAVLIGLPSALPAPRALAADAGDGQLEMLIEGAVVNSYVEAVPGEPTAHTPVTPHFWQCPETLISLPHWFETDPVFYGLGRLHFRIDLLNDDPWRRTLEFNEERPFQLWSVPGVLTKLPLTVVERPSAPVPFGEKFSYEFTVEVCNLPPTEYALGFRPYSRTSGTMPPSWAPMVAVEIECFPE